MDVIEIWKVGLGLVIRKRRQEKALSQESFAHDVGLTRNAIQKLERGATNLGFESLIKIAIALELGPAELLDEVAGLISKPTRFTKAKAQMEDERKSGRPLKRPSKSLLS